jgi:mannosyltransferase OCH1-like enzyme
MNIRLSLERALTAWKDSPPPDIIAEITQQQEIPRIIHQIFATRPGRSLPPELQHNIEAIRLANPDWEYRLYDESSMVDFIELNYGPLVLEYFRRIDPSYGAARADLFRYLLLYRVGGVYLDVKSSISKPLNDILQGGDRYLLAHWRNNPGEEFAGWGIYPELSSSVKGEFQQWHIVAAAGHPFLRAVIQRVLWNIASYNPILHGVGLVGVMRTTGPIAYTLAILPLLRQYSHRIVDSERDLGFEYSIYRRASAANYGALFGPHYSKLRQPVVKQTVADRVSAPFLMCVKAVWNGKKFIKKALTGRC